MKEETKAIFESHIETTDEGTHRLTDEGIRLACESEGISDVRAFKCLYINELSVAFPELDLRCPSRKRIAAALRI